MSSSPNDIVVSSLAISQKLLNRYCEDLKPDEYLHRPCAGANCAAWLIGHLILTERMALKRVGATDVPPLPDGFEKRFARDAEAPKSNEYGDVASLMPLFNQHRQLLIDTVKRLPPAALDQSVEKPHPMFNTIGEAVNFMGAHTSMHAGQITMIRRSLGRPPLV